MQFRHKIEKVNINGLKEFSVQYYLCEELLIGRGTSCELRLPFRSVAIVHAKLQANAKGKIIIKDLTGQKGVRVNGHAVVEHVLEEGEQVQIGEASFKTFYDGTYWGFHEVRAELANDGSDAKKKEQLKKLNLSRFYPTLTSLSLLAMAVVVLLFFADPIVGKDKDIWSSGPISNVHRLNGHDCGSCHLKPFVPVQDDQCMVCHKMTDHAEVMPALFKDHPQLNKRCGECHIEHNGGVNPVDTDSKQCITCHKNLSVIHADGGRPKVPSFGKHPEFRVSVVNFDGSATEAGKVTRTALDKGVEDPTRLAFGHKKHLEKGLRGLDKGVTSLKCVDCHALADNRRDIIPIDFEKNCSSCHPLTFDERLPGKQVPHGNAADVYNYIYAEYAKLFLVSKPQSERVALVQRFKPGTTVIAEPDIQFTRSFVESETRNTEREIFTRTGCKTCHTISKRENFPDGETAFKVLKPYLPYRWFPAAQFNHGSHDKMSCESCHSSARESKKTGDILLPKVALCQSCHVQDGKASTAETSKVSTPCITCHSYHDSVLLDDPKKRSVKEILIGNAKEADK